MKWWRYCLQRKEKNASYFQSRLFLVYLDVKRRLIQPGVFKFTHTGHEYKSLLFNRIYFRLKILGDCRSKVFKKNVIFDQSNFPLPSLEGRLLKKIDIHFVISRWNEWKSPFESWNIFKFEHMNLLVFLFCL